MFDLYDERARLVVVLAQEDARVLRHDAIGVEHLLLGVCRVDQSLVGALPEELRERVATVNARGEDPSPEQLPFTPAAQRVLELALETAADAGAAEVAPEHVLLTLIDDDVVARLRLDSESLRARATVAARGPRDDGGPVAVYLGGRLPIGDLGSPRTDARMLLAILAVDGAAAKLLRERGVSEQVVRGLAPDLS